LVETARFRVLESNERRDTGLKFWMSVVSRVGFFRSALILAVLKVVGNRPELREVLIMVVRKGRMSPEMSWRREDGIRSRGQVVAWLDVTSLLTSSEAREGEAGKAQTYIQSQSHKEGPVNSCSVSLGCFHLVVDLICQGVGPRG